MGGISKAVKKIAKPFAKGLGYLTGANAQEKASKDMSRQMDAQAAQERSAALAATQDSAQQARAAQASVEQGIARDAATQAAADSRAAALQSNDTAVDVERAAGDTTTDDSGRRVAKREKFQGKSGSTGLRL